MGHIVRSQGHVVPAEVVDARALAQRLLDEARTVASNAQATVAAARAEAEREGHRAGLERARDEARAEVAEVLAAAAAERERARAAARPLAIAIGRRLAEKVLAASVSERPELLVRAAEAAIAESRAHGGRVVVRIHPDDLPRLEAERPRLAARLGAGVELDLVVDAEIRGGGVVVDSAVGRVDGRWQSQLDALERALLGDDAAGGDHGR